MPDLSLPHPPRVPHLPEFAAVVEPSLRDIPEYEGPDIDAWEPVDVERDDDERAARLAEDARRLALDDERVRRLLGDKRHVVIGVSFADDKDREGASLVLVGYSYDDALAYEVLFEGSGNDLRVVDVATADYQPAPADEEIETAIAIAREDPRVGQALEDDFEAHALLVSDVEPGDEHYGRRRFSVVFGPPAERLPAVHALVDVGDATVLGVTVDGRRR